MSNLDKKQVTRKDFLCLIAEWMDPIASLLKKYYLFFYPFDSTIEMYDMKRNRIFLRRVKVKNLGTEDIFIGNVISVFNRQIRLTDYGNNLTRKILSVTMMKTFALIKPSGFNRKGIILKMLLEKGFKIANLRMIKCTETFAQSLFETEQDTDTYMNLIAHVQEGPCIALELVGNDAVSYMRKVAGPRDPIAAKAEDPGSIIAIMGGDSVKNGLFYARNVVNAAEQIKFMFSNPKTVKNTELHTVKLENSTCSVIKPHVMKEGTFGRIIDAIEANDFEITAMQMFYLEVVNAEEFYEIYKGVLLEFNDMVQELTSGGCVALEIVSKKHGKNTPSAYRAFCGPSDPDIARKLRPETLRAKFGSNKIKNAVHVTDLPADGPLEVEYFFKVLL